MATSDVKLKLSGSRDGSYQVVLEGSNLSWPNDGVPLCGIKTVYFLAGTSWLRFDVDPEASDRPENFPSRSSLELRNYQTTERPDIRMLNESGPGKYTALRFCWPCPLSPYGGGLWFELILDPENGVVKINTQSQLWYKTKEDRWQSEPLFSPPPVLPARKSAQEWLDAWGNWAKPIKYQHGLPGCPIFSKAAAQRWLMDLSENHASFLLNFVKGKGEEAGDFPEFHLCSRVQLTGEDLAQVQVNTVALGIDTKSLPFVPRVFGLNLACVRALGLEKNEGDDRLWVIDWTAIPGDADADTFSLRLFYSFQSRHYTLGLAAVRARNRLTFIPTALWAEKATTFRFLANSKETLLQQVLFGKDSKITLELNGVTNTDDSRPTLTYSTPGMDLNKVDRVIGAAIAEFVRRPENVIEIPLQAEEGHLKPVIGGVLIDTGAQSPSGSELKISRQPGQDLYGQPPVGVLLTLLFDGASISPVSQDPEVGYETLSAWLNRERPFAYNLGLATPLLQLQIRETANHDQSRLLSLDLTATKAGDVTTDSVIIDPSPFTIARVITTTTVSENELVAQYLDDSEQPSGWTFQDKTGSVALTLPPQVIGEEMIKGQIWLDGQLVPIPNQLFDFRLSCPAQLSLDRTDINTARSIAPWDLRRMLGQRDGVVGLKVDSAAFELLYGMKAQVNDADKSSSLRIAELDAFVGRIPFGQDLLTAYRHKLARQKQIALSSIGVSQDLQELQEKYSLLIAHWIKDLFYRPNWWPVFSDFTDRRALTISSGVTFTLRPTRQTADPFAPANSVNPGADPAVRPPLRGGVDWPFQSLNVYQELLKTPRSDFQNSITGLAFSSLGGTGSQKAVFANGKTLIITSTTQGRLNNVTVIRLGRIAMLWNHARHVIVYERTSRRAPRYATDTPPPKGLDDLDSQSSAFEGFAALRKVREYIEITEAKRTYPDSTSSRPICGPLLQSTFETTVIPVKASWGRDINNGWVMSLRGPMSPDEARYFPFPKIFLELARTPGKGQGSISHQVSDPSQLLFFTSTRDQDGQDTDIWPAWPDVDFPLIPCPVPPALPYASSFAGARKQPDAAGREFGQKKFTLDLFAAEEAVNLMHGRPGGGIEGKVRNLTLARGLPEGILDLASDVGRKMAPAFGENAAQMHDGLAELSARFVDLARQYSTAKITDFTSLRSDAQGVLNRLRNAVSAIPWIPKIDSFVWKNEQEKWNTDAMARLNKVALDIKDQFDLKNFAPPEQMEQLCQQLRHVLSGVQQQAKQALNEIGFLPEKALERVRSARKELGDQLLYEASACATRLRGKIADVQKRYTESQKTASELIAALLLAYQEEATRLDTLAQDAEHWVETSLGPWFSTFSPDASTAFNQFISAAEQWLKDRSLEIDGQISAIQNAQPIDFKALDEFLTKFITGLDLGTKFKDLDETWINSLESVLAGSGLNDGLNSLYVDFDKGCKDLLGILNGGSPDIIKIQTTIAAINNGASKLATAPLNQAINDAFNKVRGSDAWKAIEGNFDQANQVVNAINNYIGPIENAIQNDASSLLDCSKIVKDNCKSWGRVLRAAGSQIEQAVRSDLLEKVMKGLPDKASETALELTRVLASGPVNDTIACTRDAIGYFYKSASDLLDVTRSSAIFNDLGPAVLNALSAQVPFDAISDRLLPQIDKLNLSDLLPDFGGLKLKYLLPDLKINGANADWLTVRHGFDKDRLTAWTDIKIEKIFNENPTLFDLSLLELQLLKPTFRATSRMELGSHGGRVQKTQAALSGNWALNFNGSTLVTIKNATLNYDSAGGFKFDFQSNNIEMAGALQFVTDALRPLLPKSGSGVTLTPLAPGGVRAELSLPLPDLGTGAFTLTGITLSTHLDLLIADGFELRTGFWLSKPDRPFGLAILFLGGGGWIGLEASYQPVKGTFSTRVSIGISAGAFLGINLGVASGSAGILFTAGLDWIGGQGGGTDISIGLLVWGEFNVLGIASASLSIILRITYDSSGGMQGYGEIRLSIKICWCFTLEVDSSTTMQFSKPGGGNRQAIATMNALSLLPANNKSLPEPKNYGELPEPKYRDKAIDLYFQNLDFADS